MPLHGCARRADFGASLAPDRRPSGSLGVRGSVAGFARARVPSQEMIHTPTRAFRGFGTVAREAS